MPTGDKAAKWLCAQPSCGECEDSWLFCPRCGQPRLTIPSEADLKWLGNRLRRFDLWEEVALEAWKILVFPQQVPRKDDPAPPSAVEESSEGFFLRLPSELRPWLSPKVDELGSRNASLRRELEIVTGEGDRFQATVRDLRGRIAILSVVMVTFKGKILATQKALLRVLSGTSELVGSSSDSDLRATICDIMVMATEVESLLVTLHEKADEDLRTETSRVLSTTSSAEDGE